MSTEAKNTATEAKTPAAETKKSTTEKKVEQVSDKLKPNLLDFLGKDKKIFIKGNKGENLPITLEEYEFDKSLGDMIHISCVNYSVAEGSKSYREPIKTIGHIHFLNCASVQSIRQKTRGGAVAFRLDENKRLAAFQAFNILLACTEHTKDAEGAIIFTDKAKKLVGTRFDLQDNSDIIRKCRELLWLSWGNVQAYVTDIVHYPDFTGKPEIDKWCMPSAEKNIAKNLPTLPE